MQLKDFTLEAFQMTVHKL